MVTIEEQLKYEIDWRTKEISVLKTLPFMFSLSDAQKNVLRRHSIPGFYSAWEGFVKEGFRIYVHFLNDLNLTHNEVDIKIIAHDIDNKLKLNNGRIRFDKKVELVNSIRDYFDCTINISPQLPTESNINFEVMNQILDRFNLSLLPEQQYKRGLSKLLKVRNSIAHGENSIPISSDLVDELSQLVLQLMDEIAIRIVDGLDQKRYMVLVL